jgi:hypothetical protein
MPPPVWRQGWWPGPRVGPTGAMREMPIGELTVVSEA